MTEPDRHLKPEPERTVHKLNHIEHSHLAERLIESVGGLAAAARIAQLGATSLSNYQNPNAKETMPARVISALQYAGRTKIYSDAISAEVDQDALVAADPMHHACGLVKEAAEALGAIERAMADGVISAADFTACERELADVEERLAVIRSGLRGKLKVVG